MAFLVTIAALFFVLAIWLFQSRVVLRTSEEECHSLLEAWTEENGMTLLRCRPCWWFPEFDLPPRVTYRVSVEDPEGRLRSGWACIFGRKTGVLEFTPRSVEMSLGRARDAPRSAKPASSNKVKLLWDDGLDG